MPWCELAPMFRRPFLACAIVAAIAFGGCSTARRVPESGIEHARRHSFFLVPNPLPAGAPGTLIRVRRLLGAPNQSIAWRVLYHSRDFMGHDIAISGIVVSPTRRAQQGGRPIVSWGHPTTGSAEKCGPSTGVDPFVTIEGLHALLGAGDVIAATDYPGMGAAGPTSYLIGASEGNSMLDAARAARAIPAAHASNRLLLWGHSQGGHAALFAAVDAPRYAPDLHLTGVAVAAPAVELGALLRDDIGDTVGVTLGAFAFDAYRRAYATTVPAVSLASILTPAGVAATPEMVKMCSLPPNRKLNRIARALIGRYLRADPARVEPWKTWLQQNTPPDRGITAPLLVAQGAFDTIVRPATTTAYVRALCANGELVRYTTIARTGHGLVAYRAAPIVDKWFADLLAGRRVTRTCPQ